MCPHREPSTFKDEEPEMTAHTCKTCALAEWERTAAGRLHPSQFGRCRWVAPEFPLPISIWHGNRKMIMSLQASDLDMRPILRDKAVECPAWRKI